MVDRYLLVRRMTCQAYVQRMIKQQKAGIAMVTQAKDSEIFRKVFFLHQALRREKSRDCA
jgi:hypothetical protein